MIRIYASFLIAAVGLSLAGWQSHAQEKKEEEKQRCKKEREGRKAGQVDTECT